MIQIISRQILLTPEHNKTNIRVPFRLAQAWNALFIHTCYDPKIVSDEAFARQQIEAGIRRYIPEQFRGRFGQWKDYMPVVNFITLSLDYEDEYIGCAHRHSPDQSHIISSSYSSPGFYRHAVLPGNWECVLNCHAVVDSSVIYTIQVFCADKDEELHDHIQAF